MALAAQRVGSIRENFALGKALTGDERAAAEEVAAQYQAPAAGMARPTNYAAYAEAISDPGNPNHEAAMALAAQRIRAIRENGLA
jgi:hypothetical protein